MSGAVVPRRLAALCGGEFMKALFRISGGRWSATVGNFKPGSFGDDAITLGAVFRCEGERVVCYGFARSFKELAGTRRGGAGPVVAYAELLEFSFARSEHEDLRRLVSALDALCASVQQGGSAEGWCKRQGLRPIRARRGSRGRTRPGQLRIRIKGKTFVLPCQRFSGTRLVQRRGAARTRGA
jgi:hypothetical protein